MKTIIRNSVFMGLFNVFGRGSGFIRYLLLVGFLSDANYGLITYAFSLGEIGRNFMDWGLDNLISRDGARDYAKVPRYLLHGLLIKTGLGLLLFALVFGYLVYWRDLSWSELGVVYAALTGSAMLSITGVLRSCFTAIERMEYVFYTNLPVRLISMVVLLAVLWLGWPVVFAAGAVSLENFLWFVLLGAIAVSFFSVERIAFSPSFAGYMLLTSLPLGLYQFFNNMYINLDVVMIESILGGREHVAPYTYASYFLKGVLMLLSGYMIAIYPALSRYYQTDEKAYARLFTQSVIILLSMTIPGTVLMSFWADGWMNWIKETDPVTETVFQILAVTMNISVLNTLLIIAFTSRDRQWWLVGFCGLGVGISFLTNWFMIPPFKQIGAAYASLISQSILLILMGYCASSLFSLRFPIVKPLGLLFTSVLAGYLVRSIPGLPLLSIPLVYGTVLLVFVWIFRVLTWDEMSRIMQRMREKE